nr:hypothetical protein [Kibdelosporangium sp. MJ126-NF4]
MYRGDRRWHPVPVLDPPRPKDSTVDDVTTGADGSCRVSAPEADR